MPDSTWEILSVAAIRSLVVTSVFGIIFLVGFIAGGINGWDAALLMLFLSIVACLKGGSDAYSVLLARPKIAISDGKILIGHGSRAKEIVRALSDVTWDYGSSRESYCLSRTRSQAVLIVSYTVFGGPSGLVTVTRRVACGWTPSRREMLAAFFGLAGVRQGKPPIIAFGRS